MRFSGCVVSCVEYLTLPEGDEKNKIVFVLGLGFSHLEFFQSYFLHRLGQTHKALELRASGSFHESPSG
jgi:hypothetical protein